MFGKRFEISKRKFEQKNTGFRIPKWAIATTIKQFTNWVHEDHYKFAGLSIANAMHSSFVEGWGWLSSRVFDDLITF